MTVDKLKKITFARQVREGWPFLILLFLPLCVAVRELYLYGHIESYFWMVVAPMMVGGPFLLGGLIIHINYLLINSGCTLKEFGDGRLLFFEKSGGSIEIEDKNILEIFVCCSPPISESAFQYLPWDGYCYARVLLASGKEMIVTSLLDKELVLRFVERFRRGEPRCRVLKSTYPIVRKR